MDDVKKRICKEIADELGYDEKFIIDLIKNYESTIPELIRNGDKNGEMYQRIFLYRFGTIRLRKDREYDKRANKPVIQHDDNNG